MYIPKAYLYYTIYTYRPFVDCGPEYAELLCTVFSASNYYGILLYTILIILLIYTILCYNIIAVILVSYLV